MSTLVRTVLSVSADRSGPGVVALDTAHYLVTKHSQRVRLTLSVAVTARVYISRVLEHRIIRRRPRYLPGCCN